MPALSESDRNPTQRLDRALVTRGLAPSRSAAQNLIRGGIVTVNDAIVARPSCLVAGADKIDLAGATNPYVGRGGLKLEAAIRRFSVPVSGARCLDVGSSTGGFTDCLLQAGAASVVGVDVGHGQMSARLLADPRVENREGVNARTLSPAMFDHSFDVIVVDLSFISLMLVLKAISRLLDGDGILIALVKPQFEVGPEKLGKNGIVRSESDRQAALARIGQFGVAECGLAAAGTMESPICGGDGNIEFLAAFRERTQAFVS